MAINFEAANMAGYNNPRVQVFPVTAQVEGTSLKLVGAPSYSTITNVIKSGYLPTLFVTLPSGDRSILPLSAINKEEQYIFSAAMHTTDSPDTRRLISVLFGEHLDAPHFFSTGI